MELEWFFIFHKILTWFGIFYIISLCSHPWRTLLQLLLYLLSGWSSFLNFHIIFTTFKTKLVMCIFFIGVLEYLERLLLGSSTDHEDSSEKAEQRPTCIIEEFILGTVLLCFWGLNEHLILLAKSQFSYLIRQINKINKACTRAYFNESCTKFLSFHPSVE